MPSGYINIDAHFPAFSGNESQREQTEQMLNYLRILTDRLRYCFGNIGRENFNETELREIKKDITAELEESIKVLSKSIKTQTEAIQRTTEELEAVEKQLRENIRPGLQTLQEAVQVTEDSDIVIGGEGKSVELTGTVTVNGREIMTA